MLRKGNGSEMVLRCSTGSVEGRVVILRVCRGKGCFKGAHWKRMFGRVSEEGLSSGEGCLVDALERNV